MEVPGECAICGAHGIVKTCSLCGAHVCLKHYDAAASMDVRCAHGGRGPGRKTPDEAEAENLPPLPEDAGGRLT